MTQIKKTLSIAGIIALATAPAMAEIASTAYVQSIVNSINIPTYTAGDGIVIDSTGNKISLDDDTTAKLAAIDADEEMANIAIGGNTVVGSYESTVIGNGASAARGQATAIGVNAKADAENSTAIGSGAVSNGGIAINNGYIAGYASAGTNGVAIGTNTSAGTSGVAIGVEAYANNYRSIVLGSGTSKADKTLYVGFGDTYPDGVRQIDVELTYPLINSQGLIPAGRLVAQTTVGTDNNGTNGQLLASDGQGGLEWVDAPALESMLPTAPNGCKASDGQKCALVMTWSSSQNKFTYDWEIVKVSE